MPFKIPGLPSKQCGVHELGDYIEWQAWLSEQTSVRTILAEIGRLDDNFDNEGCEDDADEAAEVLEEVMIELEGRQRACNGGYPFTISDTGTLLISQRCESVEALLYRFMLLATRLRMDRDREFEGIRGDLLFEEICAQILRNYLGYSVSAERAGRSRCLTFGTSRSVSFSDRVDDLCRAIGEGDRFEGWDPGPALAQDGKLDAVSWIPFSDGKPSQIAVFAQCKTGSSDSWKGKLGELKPTAFLKSFTLKRAYQLDPIPAFFVAEAANPSEWNEITSRAELFFDRCRIVDFGHSIDIETVAQMRKWTDAALQHSLGNK